MADSHRAFWNASRHHRWQQKFQWQEKSLTALLLRTPLAQDVGDPQGLSKLSSIPLFLNLASGIKLRASLSPLPFRRTHNRGVDGAHAPTALLDDDLASPGCFSVYSACQTLPAADSLLAADYGSFMTSELTVLQSTFRHVLKPSQAMQPNGISTPLTSG